MMPFVAILSTIDTVALSASLAPSTSLESSEARIAFSAVRSRDRSSRLCSRRLTFWRFAFRADFVRLATFTGVLSVWWSADLTKEQFYHLRIPRCGFRLEAT